ncbi:MAG TPA: MFS transporter [Candidatus Sulfotelmatobacter sp.]|nr:MFS transporter [Candidatus Sulfotelmatobacter sp.]
MSTLRHRDFALLVLGQAVSQVGDGIFGVALAWRVYQSYSSPAALSVVGIAFFVPRLVVTIAGGVFSDRFDRRWTMIAADCGRSVAVGALAAISLSQREELVALVLFVALQGIAGSVFGPAESALLPELVSADELGRANSIRTIVSPLAWSVVGPALGGALIANLGTSSAFWADAGTYLVSVATLLAMRTHRVTRQVEHTSVFAEAREGVAYVAGRPWLWGPIVASSVAQFLYAGPNQALVPYLVKFELHASAGALGLVLAAGGVGTMAAGFLMGRISRPRNIVVAMVLGWAAGIGSIAGVGLARTVWEAALAVFVWNLLLWSGEILWLTLLGLTVPNHIRGRVSSIDFLGSYWMIPLSMALTGPLAGLVGPRLVLIGAGVGGAAAVLMTLAVPGVTRPRFLPAAAT